MGVNSLIDCKVKLWFLRRFTLKCFDLTLTCTYNLLLGVKLSFFKLLIDLPRLIYRIVGSQARSNATAEIGRCWLSQHLLLVLLVLVPLQSLIPLDLVEVLLGVWPHQRLMRLVICMFQCMINQVIFSEHCLVPCHINCINRINLCIL
jgi:hypothetical protein